MRTENGGQNLYLCAHLPCWPIDRLRRRRAELRHKPLVLVQTAANRADVVHVSPECPPGIFPGMALTEARARLAELIDLPEAPEEDRRALDALGRWLMRFSPGVCVYPPASLFLDASGLDRLYGHVDNLRLDVAEALARLRIHATIKIAPTPGAAWALAAFGKNGPPCINPREIHSALGPLPIEALRLEAQTVELLHGLGVRSIEALRRLSRRDLFVRFGASILTRIDQAAGAAAEPLNYLTWHCPIRASLEFETAIESLESIALVLRELVREIAAQLTRRGLGARELRVIFRQPYAPAVEMSLRLARPCRSEHSMMKLLECAIERQQTSEGVIGVTLSVASSQRLDDQQIALIGGEEARDEAEVDHLTERLHARLRPSRNINALPAEWGELLESNLPENASRCVEAACAPAGGTARRIIDRLRPLRLLRQPRPITAIVRPSESREGAPVSFTDRGQVHRLDHVRGPERITGQWWSGRWKTRDYFDVLDMAGSRYWIFRVAQSGRWFLHGVFE